MPADQVGEQDLRSENFERMVKGFALQEFKMKQLVMVQSSSSWIETYYRETAAELTGGTGTAVKGIPRLADFPSSDVSWTKIQAYIEKYGMSAVISWEDAMTSNIDVIARTLLRVSRAVAYAIDSQIFSVLNSAAGNSVTIAAGSEWNSATIANRDPVLDILQAKKELYIDNYDPDGNETYLVMNPSDYTYLLSNSKVINNPTFKAADVVANGVVGKIAGLKIIVSNVVNTSGALVVIGKECGTWKEAAPLSVFTDVDKGIKYTIKAYEMGVCQATSPNAICKIIRTAI